MPSGNRGLWYLRVRAKHGDPKRRKRRSTRPHFGRGPVYIGGGGGGTGRARARFNGRRRVRLDAQRSRRRVQSTIRATGVQRRYTRCTDTKNANGTDFALIVSCSTLASSDWRYWYIRKNKKKKKNTFLLLMTAVRPIDARLFPLSLYCVIYERFPIR